MESYSTDFSLDRLVLGVDNIRCDVRLSPAFCTATAKLAALLIERETGIWTGFRKKALKSWPENRNATVSYTGRS
jgi:hypothetical protein